MSDTSMPEMRVQSAVPSISRRALTKTLQSAGITLGAVAIFFAARSGYARGLEQVSGLAWSVAAVAISTAALILPSQLRHASNRLPLAGVYALTLLLAIAGSLGAAQNGRDLGSSSVTHDAETRNRAMVGHASATDELARLAPARPAGELQLLIKPLDTKIGTAICDDWLPNKAVRNACASRHGLLTELARAQRRVELEAKQTAAATTLAAAPTTDTANADAIAIADHLAALGIAINAGTVAKLLTILLTLTLEIAPGVLLACAPAAASPGGQAGSQGSGGESVAIPQPAPPAPQLVIQQPNSAVTHPASNQATRAVVEALKQRIAADLTAGSRAVSHRRLANELGASVGSLQRAIHELAAERRVSVSADRSGTRLELVVGA